MARIPSSFIRCLKTSLTPLYWPSGAENWNKIKATFYLEHACFKSTSVYNKFDFYQHIWEDKFVNDDESYSTSACSLERHITRGGGSLKEQVFLWQTSLWKGKKYRFRGKLFRKKEIKMASPQSNKCVVNLGQTGLLWSMAMGLVIKTIIKLPHFVYQTQM